MLIGLNINNYKSFGSLQEFTMVPGRVRSKPNHVIKENYYNALKIAVLFGGNASGKSNFIDSFSKIQDIIIKGSITKTLSDYSFRLTNEPNLISEFELSIGIDKYIYVYGFSVSFVEGKIFNEYLYEVSSRETMIFDLEEEHKINLDLISKDNKKRVEIYISDLNSNDLLINKIAKANVQQDKFFEHVKNVHRWITKKLVIIKPSSNSIKILSNFTEHHNENHISIIDIIKTFDTGITDYKYESLEVNQFLNTIIRKMDSSDADLFHMLENIIKNIKSGEEINLNIFEDYYRVTKNSEHETIIELLKLEHSNFRGVEFSFNEESDGTMRLIELVNILYQSQFSNITYIVDEIDRSLHPKLTYSFIEQFIKYSKENRSQLILTTHETKIMDFNLLRQDEIWLIDRTSEGMSKLIHLNKYKIRKDKILDKDYLDGRYGGIPNISGLIKEDAFEKNDE